MRVAVCKVATRRWEFGTQNATRIGPRTQERQPPLMLGTAYREERFPFLGPAVRLLCWGVEVFDNLLNIVHARHLPHVFHPYRTEPIQGSIADDVGTTKWPPLTESMAC